MNTFSKWKFERISQTEIRRTLLSDGTNEVLSDIPNEKGHAIHVEEYIARRIAGGKKAMFGEMGNTVWFGGHRGITLPRMIALWTNRITPRTELLADDYKKRDWPDHELKKMLVIVTNDFSNERRSRMEEADIERFAESDLDPDDPQYIEPITHAARKRNIDWRNLPSMSGAMIDQILDRSQHVAIRRDLVRTEGDIVRVRTRT